jgi:hypothetical protein
MLSKLLPLTINFLRQIAPSVAATLIAAVLIAGYNRAFSGNLVQPRMAAMQSGTAAEPVKPAAEPAAKPVTEVVTIYEFADEPERKSEKDGLRESGKDRTSTKVADAAPAPAPAPRASVVRGITAPTEPRAEPRREARVFDPRAIESRLAAAPAMPVAQPVTQPVIVQQPVVAQPAAPQVVPVAPGVVVAAAPPPGMGPAYPAPPVVTQPAAEPSVVTAKPMVTVPDRAPAAEPQQEAMNAPPPPQQNGFGSFLNELRPSSIFTRMREFGNRIEATGNDILPNIRQQ